MKHYTDVMGRTGTNKTAMQRPETIPAKKAKTAKKQSKKKKS